MALVVDLAGLATGLQSGCKRTSSEDCKTDANDPKQQNQ